MYHSEDTDFTLRTMRNQGGVLGGDRHHHMWALNEIALLHIDRNKGGSDKRHRAVR